MHFDDLCINCRVYIFSLSPLPAAVDRLQQKEQRNNPRLVFCKNINFKVSSLRVSSNLVFFFAIVFYLGLWGVFRLLFYYIYADGDFFYSFCWCQYVG